MSVVTENSPMQNPAAGISPFARNEIVPLAPFHPCPVPMTASWAANPGVARAVKAANAAMVTASNASAVYIPPAQSAD